MKIEKLCKSFFECPFPPSLSTFFSSSFFLCCRSSSSLPLDLRWPFPSRVGRRSSGPGGVEIQSSLLLPITWTSVNHTHTHSLSTPDLTPRGSPLLLCGRAVKSRFIIRVLPWLSSCSEFTLHPTHLHSHHTHPPTPTQ